MSSFTKRLLASAAILLALCVAAYWYGSPYLVVREMRSAAIDADADRFNDHVDYPRLRDSLKGQISTRITGDLVKQTSTDHALEGAGSALGSLLGLALIDRLVDTVVRPDVVMRAMEQGRFRIKGDDRQHGERDAERDGERDGERRAPSWHIERKGVDEVLIHVDDDAAGAGKSGTAFVMRRDGFANWKLTDIHLPD